MVQKLELWGHWGAPNPWKVAMVMEELSLPYKINYLELNETKSPSYLEVTPNGRLPTLKDPNTGITLWEGPYFGQATWFARFHPEKIQSAIDRYVDEILRVIGVIDLGLRRNTAAGNWLVGDKLGKNEGLEKDYPKYSEWIAKTEEQDSVKKIRDLMNKGRISHGLKV
ncbi:hypothetical protein ZTR_07147 [Talaromyces verruculosus]|nr:hypothetical protein ZTR_07147 [Talaromyces verruculosus]